MKSEPSFSETSTDDFSAIEATTSFSMPSFSLLIILKLARLPGGHDGSTSIFLVFTDLFGISS